MTARGGCQKCADNQRKAGEALSLFNEASGALLDAEALLQEVYTSMVLRHGRGELREGVHDKERELFDRITQTLAHAGERRRVENSIREIIRPT